jgi:hypothetical protein
LKLKLWPLCLLAPAVFRCADVWQPSARPMPLAAVYAMWGAWFPMSDTFLCLCFLLPACALLVRRNHAAAWLCFLCAALTKEYAYIFPLMAFVLAIHRPTRAAWRNVAGMFAAELCLALYRRAVLPHAYNPPLPSFVADGYAFTVLSRGVFWLQMPFDAKLWDAFDNAARLAHDVATLALALSSGVLLWRTRATQGALLMAWCGLSTLPILGFGVAGRLALFPSLFALPLAAYAAHALYAAVLARLAPMPTPQAA